MASPIEDLMRQASEKFGVPIPIIKSMVKTESNFEPNAVSPVGAKGYMQLMDPTAKDLGVTNSFDPEQNINGGTRYLKQMYDKFGDWSKAGAAYNFGPGNVEKGRPWPKETQQHNQRFLDNAKTFGFDFDSQGQQSQPQSPIQGMMAQASQVAQPAQTMPAQPVPVAPNVDEIKARLGLDPKSLNRDSWGGIISDSLNGLASIVGSFNKKKGAELQQYYGNKGIDRQRAAAEQRKSAIETLMKQLKGEKIDLPTSVQEFNFAKNQDGFNEGYVDFLQKKNPIALANQDYRRDRDALLDQRYQQEQKDKINELSIKKDEAQKELIIPGYEQTGEVKPLPTEAVKLREGVARINEFEKGINDLKDLTDKYGTVELWGKGKGLLQSKSKGLQLVLKNLEELGAINGPDAGFLEAGIQSINTLEAAATSPETKKAVLDQVLSGLRSRVDARLVSSGYRKAAPQQQGNPQTPDAIAPTQGQPQSTPIFQPRTAPAQGQPQAAQPAAPEDQAAISWAKSNPNDPRAKQILQLHGVQ